MLKSPSFLDIFPQFDVTFRPEDVIDPLFLRRMFTPEYKRGGKTVDPQKTKARKAQRNARKAQRKNRK